MYEWVATYVQDGVINCKPLFQEIVNHAKTKNLTLLNRDNQIQNIIPPTCRYFFVLSEGNE